MKNFGKKLVLGLFVLTLVFSIAGCGSKEEKVIATYDGGQVTEAEFNTYISISEFFNQQLVDLIKQQPDIKKQLLNQYIGDKYLTGKVDTSNTFDEKVNTIYENIKQQKIQQLGSEKNFDKSLKDFKITETNIKDYIRNFYQIQDYFVQKAYKDDKEEFTIATVSHILIEVNENRTEEQAKTRAEEVLNKLKNGGDFAALAKEYSDDTGSSDNGGTYKDVGVASWVPEFKEAALTLPLNELSGLVKTQYGYHIMKVSARQIPKLEDVTDQQKSAIYSQKYSSFLKDELPSIVKEVNLDSK